MKRHHDGTYRTPLFVVSPVASQGCSTRWTVKGLYSGDTYRARTLEGAREMIAEARDAERVARTYKMAGFSDAWIRGEA